MKVFVAGATGAMGRQLVPRLVDAGHEVVGMTSMESNRGLVAELGATPSVADALNPDQVAAAVGQANPAVIVHQLTAIRSVDMRHFDRDFTITNRLRTEGTDHLLSAGRAVGVKRFVAQSAVYRTGGAVKSEEDPLDPSPPRETRESTAAIRHLEEAVLGATWTDGIVLRYGAFYGPGTSLSPGGEQYEMIRSRKFPLVGNGGGYGRSSTSPTPPRRRWRLSTTADPVSTTSWTTIRHRFRSGCRRWRKPGAKKPMRVPRFVGRMFGARPGRYS